MGRALPFLALLVLQVYTLVDLLRSNGADVRALPKAVWFLVWLVPVLGPIAFDRKGDVGQAFNTLYLFANAGLQGTLVIARAIRNNPQRAAKHLSAFVGLSFSLALANILMGGDDDDGEPPLPHRGAGRACLGAAGVACRCPRRPAPGLAGL